MLSFVAWPAWDAAPAELVTPGEALEASIARLSQEIGNPLLTGLTLRGPGLTMDRWSKTLFPIYMALDPCS